MIVFGADDHVWWSRRDRLVGRRQRWLADDHVCPGTRSRLPPQTITSARNTITSAIPDVIVWGSTRSRRLHRPARGPGRRARLPIRRSRLPRCTITSALPDDHVCSRDEHVCLEVDEICCEDEGFCPRRRHRGRRRRGRRLGTHGRRRTGRDRRSSPTPGCKEPTRWGGPPRWAGLRHCALLLPIVTRLQ